jgi:hypothetical protein
VENNSQRQLGQQEASVVDKEDDGGGARIVEDEFWLNFLSFSSSVTPAFFWLVVVC